MRISPLLACVFASALVGAVPVGAEGDAVPAADKPADKPAETPAEAPAERAQPASAARNKPRVAGDASQAPLFPSLRWTSPFPDAIEAGTDLALSWDGGSPEYGFEVYYIPRWPRQRMYELVTIENTTEHSIVWSVPAYDEYPDGTTFIFGVKDSTGGPGGNWYDLSGPLPFIDPAPDARAFEAAIKAKAA